MTVQEYINELEKIEDKSKELDSPLPSIIGTILYILGYNPSTRRNGVVCLSE